MKAIFFSVATTLVLIACGTPTPSEADIYFATHDAEQAIREKYFDCTSTIDDQVRVLEQSADACPSDYDCKAKIAQQIEELGNKLTSTCTPVPPGMSSDFACHTRLIQAKANYIHGAPNESGANRVMAEETLADQLKEAYDFCFSSLPEPNP